MIEPALRWPTDAWSFGGRSIVYAIRRSPRARALNVLVHPSCGVVVTAPLRVEREAIIAFLTRHRSWIVRQVDRLAAVAAALPRRWPYGPTLPYLGQEHHVEIRQEPGRGQATRMPDAAVVKVRMPQPTIDAARRVLQRWYRAEALHWCTERTTVWGERLGVTWTQVAIRNQRTRWGSCSARGSLSFNYRLVMAPLPVLDYVIVHELAHRREMNHSARFWGLVAAHVPDYRHALGWLKRHGAFLEF